MEFKSIRSQMHLLQKFIEQPPEQVGVADAFEGRPLQHDPQRLVNIGRDGNERYRESAQYKRDDDDSSFEGESTFG